MFYAGVQLIFDMDTSDSFNIQAHRTGVEYFLQLFQIRESEPSLEHVTCILRSFSLLPYENLSKILNLNQNWQSGHFRWPQDIISDYERFRLGGTCFSLTFFLKAILDYFGYNTAILMADMKSGQNTHCLLRLDYDNREFLLDPGYLLQYPLPLDSIADYGRFILKFDINTSSYSLFTVENGRHKLRYKFLNTATSPADFMQYWDDSFHWMTMHGICLSRRDENGFIYLHNHFLKRVTDTEYFKGNITTDLSEIVQNWFGIPSELVRSAQTALLENLHHDKDLGFQVPRWLK